MTLAETAPTAILRREEDLPFVEIGDGSTLQVLQVDLAAGIWIIRNKFTPGMSVQRHRHTGSVYAFTNAGAWHYLESADEVNVAGSYLFEPAGSVHTLHVLDDNTEPTDVWFTIHGANLTLSVGMGEVTSDWLVHRLAPPLAVAIGTVLLALALLWQVSLERYVAWVYWLCVVVVSIVGTMAADVLHVGLGIPYVVSTAFWAIVLAVVFVAWRRIEGSLSIHSVVTRRRELFYWAAVLATFALGTAAGDMTAHTLGLGFLASGILFTVLMVIPIVAYRTKLLGGVAAFWTAYVLTRPIGASFADYLGMPTWRGGLGIGTGVVALVLTALIVVCVAVLAITRQDVESPAMVAADEAGLEHSR